MKTILEGSQAIAEVVKRCQPAVISAYPITPQTHIVEHLAQLKADGLAGYEYVRSESEFSAASIVAGASATGVRVYTATSSQGLLLMAEVLFNIAGMRLPVVMTCANRAVSAPINIWNDQQDAMTIRDSGWIMLFAVDNQEAIDLHLQAFKIAEQTKLPVMINVDGFILTHTMEPIDLPEQKLIDKYLPKYVPAKGEYLDVDNPKTLGFLAGPAHYQGIRQQLNDDITNSKKIITSEAKRFSQIFGRKQGNGLLSDYKLKDAEIVLVTMGSVAGTIEEAIDEMRKEKIKVGLLKIKCFRPFPDEEIIKSLSKAKRIIVIDKSISLSTEGILATEIKRAGFGQSALGGKAKVQSVVTGLGGRDITKEMIKGVVKGDFKSFKFI
ncbi:MAG: transketolase C-terminal domain-containing protein [bacterium]